MIRQTATRSFSSKIASARRSQSKIGRCEPPTITGFLQFYEKEEGNHDDASVDVGYIVGFIRECVL
jgi:preprotein translocase subunit Sec61beta